MKSLINDIFPAIFFGHGNPMNAVGNNYYTRTWSKIVKSIPMPKAIIVISAHWETHGIRVTSNSKQKTIHDFYGFPKELFDIQYNPKGDEKLAKHIQNIITEVKLDDSWGLDHGSWSVLKYLYPKADIPVIQFSIDKNKTPREHYEIARKLRILRKEEILIIGSGNIVHNLAMINWNNKEAYPWAIEFNNEIKNAIITNNHDIIINYKKLSGSNYAVPTAEHFIPLIYILGLQMDDEIADIFTDKIDMGSISMMSVIIK